MGDPAMKPWLKVCNIILIGLFGCSALVLEINYSAGIAPALNVIPAGLALLAAHRPARKILAIAAIILNLLQAAGYGAALFWLLATSTDSLSLLVPVIMIPVVCITVLNCAALWRRPMVPASP